MEDTLTNTVQGASELFGSNRMWGLKDPTPPDAMAFFPQTVGWAYLAVVLILFLGFLAWRRYRRWQADGYRRDAAGVLDGIANGQGDTRKIPEILRATALHTAPRDTVAGLRGADFVYWLNQQTKQPVFASGDCDLLDQLPYISSATDHEQSARQLASRAAAWVRGFHVSV